MEGADLPFWGHAGHADPLDGWRCCSQKRVMARSIQATLNKRVWICDICHKQIHVRKQISIRCSGIEHWVHLRCAGICQAQYTDTWACHLHRESRPTTHTYIIPPHPSRPWFKPLSTPHLHHPHHHNQNTDRCQTVCSHRIGKAQTQSYHPLTATTASTKGTTTTSQTDQRRPHDYIHNTRI